jgi:hypothetical protein
MAILKPVEPFFAHRGAVEKLSAGERGRVLVLGGGAALTAWG